MIVGTDIWTCNAGVDYIQMWTRQEFVDRFGRAFNNSRDLIVAMNGDASAQAYAKVLGCYYDSGTIGCYVGGHVTGSIRLNFAAIFQ